MNFLVYAALKASGYDREAYEFAEKSLSLLKKGWDEENGIFENYNSITGSGGDKRNADPFYHWGGFLLAAGKTLQYCEDKRYTKEN